MLFGFKVHIGSVSFPETCLLAKEKCSRKVNLFVYLLVPK